jgi:hypothetical protein
MFYSKGVKTNELFIAIIGGVVKLDYTWGVSVTLNDNSNIINSTKLSSIFNSTVQTYVYCI